MNVIIRLKNLPWTANAMDIRSFFKGLSIPEGGVHIVGGENGDAFIAFSTDEDARQAMAMTGGKLKEIQVTLLLSSRAEMQKVIEKARQTSMSLFQLPTPTQVVEPKTVKISNNNFKTSQKLTDSSLQLPQVPQPPIISLTSFLAQTMQQKPPPQTVGLNAFTTYQNQMDISSDIPGLGFSTISPNHLLGASAYSALFSNSSDLNKFNNMNTQNMIDLKNKSMLVDAATLYSTGKLDSYNELSNRNDRRSRSRSNERSKDRVRSRDKYKSRDRSPEKRSRSSSRERRDRRQKRSRFTDADNKVTVPASTSIVFATTNTSQAVFSSNNSRPSTTLLQQPNLRAAGAPIKIPNVWDKPPPTFNDPHKNIIPSYQTVKTNGYSSERTEPVVSYNTDQLCKLQQLDGKRNPSAFQSNYQSKQGNFEKDNAIPNASYNDIGCCVRLSNVHNDTFYGDIRRYFSNLQVGQNDIKLINDSMGNRTDIVLIRFVTSDSKKLALQRNGQALNGNNLTISHISEDEFELAVDRFRPVKQQRYNNDQEIRSDVREDKNGRQKPYERVRDNNKINDSRTNGPDNKRILPKDESPNQFQPSDDYTTLIIDDLPKSAYEGDIRKIFPKVQQVLLDRYEAYVKFNTHEDAEEALRDRCNHYINNKRVFLDACAEEKFDEISRKMKRFNREPPRRRKSFDQNTMLIDEDSCLEIVEPEIHEIKDDEEIIEVPVNNPVIARRDPRKQPTNLYNIKIDRESPVASSDSNGSMIQDSRRKNIDPRSLKSDCLVLKNLEFKTSDKDVVEFFGTVDVTPTRVHILLDRLGRPCGDSFCEFASVDDATRALIKNNQYFGKNKIDIRYIPRKQVEGVLQSFAGPPIETQRNGNFGAPSSFYPENFGSPNCVLALSNVSYNATTEDILAEFWDFDLKPNQILRRYNENGQATGNACLAFNSPADAKRALNTKHLCSILNRKLYLKPL